MEEEKEEEEEEEEEEADQVKVAASGGLPLLLHLRRTFLSVVLMTRCQIKINRNWFIAPALIAAK